MKRKMAAVMLAGVMVASQFTGAVELLAAGGINEQNQGTQSENVQSGSVQEEAAPNGQETPSVEPDYSKMKLTGLDVSAPYKVTVDNVPKTIFSDDRGEMEIKKEWSGKTIQVVKIASGNDSESEPEEIVIEKIYTITLDNELYKHTVANQRITLVAPTRNGQTFIGWTIQEVGTNVNFIQPTLTFTMPQSDITLIRNYKKNGVRPAATADYKKMKITGLDAGATYTINGEDVVADSDGGVDIKKGWSNTTIKITKKETDGQVVSPVQNLPIKVIYSVMAGTTEIISVEGETIVTKAPKREGHRFKKWTAQGVDLAEAAAKETTTFIMPRGNVILTPLYTPIVVTGPKDLVYDGKGTVRVKLNISFDEFRGIQVGGKTLMKGRDYTIEEALQENIADRNTVGNRRNNNTFESEEIGILAAGGINVIFTKTYLHSLQGGVQTFKAILTTGNVDFSIKVEEPETPRDPEIPRGPESPKNPEIPKNEEKPERPATAYPDVKQKDWFYEAINYVTSKGLMTGYEDKSFGPASTLQRAQFATILYRTGGSPAASFRSVFSDVPSGTFYSLPVMWAQTSRIITGYENGTFGPSDTMTREQLATMLYRYAMLKGDNVTARASLDKFPDAGKVAKFAKEAMSWAVAEKIITGDQGRINPQAKSSRAVTATMIQRFQTGK